MNASGARLPSATKPPRRRRRARVTPSAAERAHCDRLAAEHKAFALNICKNLPSTVRDLVLQTVAAACKPGIGEPGTMTLRQSLRTTIVPGVAELVDLGNGRTRHLRPPVQRQRRMRNERYFAAVRALLLMLARMDIVTHDICRAENREFVGMRVDTMADVLELDQRRLERVLWVFDREGWIETCQRSVMDEDTGEVRAIVAVRKINLERFAAHVRPGLESEWKKISKEESQRRIDKARVLTADQRTSQSGREAAERNRLRRAGLRHASAAKPRQVEGLTSGAGLVDAIAARLRARAGPS